MPADSLFSRIEVPLVDIWSALFERKDKGFPDDKVIYADAETERSYTYLEVKNTAIEFGKGLKAAWEWQKGDVVLLYTPNSIDTGPVTWGVQWAGGIVSPANPAYTVEELVYQLKDSGAKAIGTQASNLSNARAAATQVGIPEGRIFLLGDERDRTGRAKHFTSIRPTGSTQRWRRTKAKPDELAFLVYSSGTTGLPKGVMLSHTNIVSNVMQLFAGEDGNLTANGGADGKGDTILAFLPFFHIYGLNCCLHQAIFAGLRVIVMPKFDIEKWCSAVQRYRVTFSYVVPPVILLLSKHPIVDNYDLSSLRMLNSGAAPLTHELVESAYARIKVPIKQGYGLSETSPTTHMQPWERWRSTIGSVGTMMPNMTAKYMAENGVEAPVGEPGELWVTGPNVFKGYLNNPEGTRNALTDDGYFKTGDVGYQDKNGNFYITDRIKELIKYKGFQVAPAELEGLLISHPKIDDVAVLGVNDEEQHTEVPRAYVVPKKGVEAGKGTEKEIQDWLAGKVTGYKRLRGGVRFVDDIPKSASGKILRRVLRKQAEEEGKQGVAAKL